MPWFEDCKKQVAAAAETCKNTKAFRDLKMEVLSLIASASFGILVPIQSFLRLDSCESHPQLDYFARQICSDPFILDNYI